MFSYAQFHTTHKQKRYFFENIETQQQSPYC